MHGSEEDVDGVEEVLPDVGRGQVYPLLHVAARLEPRLAELRHLRKDTVKFGNRYGQDTRIMVLCLRLFVYVLCGTISKFPRFPT